MTELYPSRTVVVCAAAERRAEAHALAERLGVECLAEMPPETDRLALVLDPERLQMQWSDPRAPGPVHAEFVRGRAGWRARTPSPRDEALARAAGLRGNYRPTVIDTTAGLGRDGFLLAGSGCRVTLIERHPVVAAVLRDGLTRATAAPSTAETSQRIELIEDDALTVLASRTADVVLVDPMYPPRRKSAAVRKEMQLFQALVGGDEDAEALLQAALAAARRRVVVKRPSGTPPLAGRTPSGSIDERSTRFDIYAGLADD
jgi:16S rRNA (guanine1516-N2)-methyltransferase